MHNDQNILVKFCCKKIGFEKTIALHSTTAQSFAAYAHL